MQHVLSTLSRLISLAKEIDADSESARLRGIFLVSQVLIFGMAPAVVRRHMGWASVNSRNLELVKAQLHQVLRQQFIGEDIP